MKAHEIALLLRLRQHRAEAAERLLVQAAQRCADRAAQRDELATTLDQVEEGRLRHGARLRSVGATGPSALHQLLPLIGISHALSRDCQGHRRRLHDAIDAWVSSDKERQVLAVEDRQLYQAALKLHYILQQYMEKQKRGRDLATESEAEEAFRALRSKPQIRSVNDA